LTDISDSVDEPPSDLKELSNFLKKRLDIQKYSVDVDNHFKCVNICRRGRSIEGFLLFTVYPDKEVADNTQGAISLKHEKCAENVKAILQNMGYSSFHNSYKDYVEKRRKQLGKI
jgi:hypothetical protein